MLKFTAVVHRAGLHCTAVGKAILVTLPRTRPPACSSASSFAHTRSTQLPVIPDLMRELKIVGGGGYATDNGELENGACCVAVALSGSPARGAISSSLNRMTSELVQHAVPMLMKTAGRLSRELDFAVR